MAKVMGVTMELLKKRLAELAEKSYRNNQYVFTNFLNMAEQNAFYEMRKDISYVPYSVYGGAEQCERVMIRFGSEELFGYEEPFPICCILAEPLLEKFADTFSHRDFLGAIMNLGIEREVVGDLLLKGKKAYIFCTEKIAPYLIENLVQVKHTSMKCSLVENAPELLAPTLEQREVTVASERIDAVLGKLCNLSRSQSVLAFREKKVFVNGRQCENNSYQLKSGDVVTFRGFGKFIYEGVNYETKKGKVCIGVSVYV